MPTSLIRRSVGLKRPHFGYGSFVSSPWAAFGLREVDAAPASGVAVTPDVSGAFGAWTQIIASTAADVDLICYRVEGTAQNGQRSDVDMNIGIGASPGSALVTTAVGNMGSDTTATAWVCIPVRVPAGSVISVQMAAGHSSAPSPSIYMGTARFPKESGFMSPSSVDSLARVQTSANDTWTEVTSSTARAYQALVFTHDSGTDSTLTTSGRSIDVGVGAASSEVQVYRESGNASTSEVQFFQGASLPARLIPGHYPAGSRLAIRSTVGSTNQTSARLVGIPYT